MTETLTNWTNPDLSLPATDCIIGWFHHIIQSERFGALEEIKTRQQETIRLYVTEDNDESLAEFGEVTWDDWTSHDNIIKRYPLPDIDPLEPSIDWVAVGRFLVKRLSLALCEIDDE